MKLADDTSYRSGLMLCGYRVSAPLYAADATEENAANSGQQTVDEAVGNEPVQAGLPK
jgi:hypothetical protein